MVIKPIPEYKGFFARSDGKVINRDGKIMSNEVRSYGLLSRIHINKQVYRDATGNLILRAFKKQTPTRKQRVVYIDGNNTNPALDNIFHANIRDMCNIESGLKNINKELNDLIEMLGGD